MTQTPTTTAPSNEHFAGELQPNGDIFYIDCRTGEHVATETGGVNTLTIHTNAVLTLPDDEFHELIKLAGFAEEDYDRA